MAQRLLAGLLALAGLIAFFPRPLVGGILLATALALYLDTRGAFGRGRFRAAIAFIAGPSIGLVGVVVTLLGLVPGGAACSESECPAPSIGNFLFLPGLMLLALGLTLLVWSVVELLRIRRATR